MAESPLRSWLTQIESARTLAELVRLLRDYLASLPPEEIAQLPKGIAPNGLHGATEVQEWAVTLAHHDLRANAESPPVLHRSAVVFAAAGARLARLTE